MLLVPFRLKTTQIQIRTLDSLRKALTRPVPLSEEFLVSHTLPYGSAVLAIDACIRMDTDFYLLPISILPFQ